MYPTSRTSFAAVLGIVGMFLLTLSTAFGWNPEIINGVQYIPMSEVRTHYKLTRERTEGRQKVYEVPEKIQIRIQARSQEMFMNNMKFVLSYPVADHPSKGLMVSNMDLHKIIDPVLRPTYIANRRSFNTVVIDPGHGAMTAARATASAGKRTSTFPWAKSCATASRPWATRWS